MKRLLVFGKCGLRKHPFAQHGVGRAREKLVKLGADQCGKVQIEIVYVGLETRPCKNGFDQAELQRRCTGRAERHVNEGDLGHVKLSLPASGDAMSSHEAPWWTCRPDWPSVGVSALAHCSAPSSAAPLVAELRHVANATGGNWSSAAHCHADNCEVTIIHPDSL